MYSFLHRRHGKSWLGRVLQDRCSLSTTGTTCSWGRSSAGYVCSNHPLRPCWCRARRDENTPCSRQSTRQLVAYCFGKWSCWCRPEKSRASACGTRGRRDCTEARAECHRTSISSNDIVQLFWVDKQKKRKQNKTKIYSSLGRTSQCSQLPRCPCPRRRIRFRKSNPEKCLL